MGIAEDIFDMIAGKAMEAAIGVEFIYEEACQAIGMGAYMAIRHGNLSQASGILDILQYNILAEARSVHDAISSLFPFTLECFTYFWDAVSNSISVMRNVYGL